MDALCSYFEAASKGGGELHVVLEAFFEPFFDLEAKQDCIMLNATVSAVISKWKDPEGESVLQAPSICLSNFFSMQD